MKLILNFLFFIVFINSVHAQGKWVSSNVEDYKYSIESTSGKKRDKLTSTNTPVESISISGGEVAFLPNPTHGTAKVFIDANTGASFTLIGKGESARLKAISSSSRATEAAPANVSKFSLYNMPTTAITNLNFTLDISAFVTEGQIIIPFGSVPENVANNGTTFNNNKQFSEWWDSENIFGAIKLDIYDIPLIDYSYRRSRIGTLDTEAPRFIDLKSPKPFTKGRSHKIELYCNNSSNSQEYVRDKKKFIVLPQTYHWWVNGEIIPYEKNNYNFPSTKETHVGSAINSFSINTSGNTRPIPNSLEVSIGGISANYIK